MIVVTLGRSSQENMGFHHASLMDSVLAILKNSEDLFGFFTRPTLKQVTGNATISIRYSRVRR